MNSGDRGTALPPPSAGAISRLSPGGTASARGKLRVAFVSTMSGAPWGGSEELWSQAALRLSRDDHAVSVSLFRWQHVPEPVSRLISAGARVSFRPPPRGGTIGDRLARAWHRRRRAGIMSATDPAWIRRQHAQLFVIGQGGPWDGVPWMLACRDAGVPYCTIVNANSEIWWPEDAYIEGIRAAYAGARRVFFCSAANLRLMEKQCAMPFAHAEVIANPIQVPGDGAMAWPPEDLDIRLASVARLEPRAKGQDLLLEVFAQPKWRNRPVQLNFYGNGHTAAGLQALAAHLGLDRVHFCGHLSQPEIWRSNHALIMASRYEGLPLVVIESLMSGRPVIATDVAGIAEMVREGENGFLAAAPTAGLIDDALERAWSRRAEWREMGLRASRHLRQTYPPDPVGDFIARLHAIAAS